MLNRYTRILTQTRYTSALARYDPTLLAKSDPAPPASGCRISCPTREDHARVQTSMRAQCGEGERSDTSPFSDVCDRSGRYSGRSRRALAQMMETQTARCRVDDIAGTVLAHGKSCSSCGSL